MIRPSADGLAADGLSRRRLLGAAAAGAAGLAMGPFGRRLVEAAASTCPAGAHLSDIEHVVILIQENRSFDHYFGTYRGVRGFADHPHGSAGVFAQRYPPNHTRAPRGRLLPFRFDTFGGDGECTNDITHDWGPQHRSWNHGAMDSFAAVHAKVNGAAYGAATMGYYTRADLPFHYALADAFTVCDRWFCSTMAPTYPNRLYSMTATIDPEGRAGGPVVTNPSAAAGIYSWETMPERLQEAGVSWKIYNQAATNNNVLALFKQYEDPTSPLFLNSIPPTFPGDFEADVAAGTLPQVSWVLAPTYFDEHPPAPPNVSAAVIAHVLDTLVGNPDVWARTVAFLTYDENGGFFDHVAPPTAPRGTADEWVTAKPLPKEADGIAGPIGLGFRVPGLVLSPFSRGGLVCSETFDHTSTLRFLETRFGVAVPNLSRWRRSVTGDLTGALNLAARPSSSAPKLPAPSPVDRAVLEECGPTFVQGQTSNVPPYPLPAKQRLPRQEPGRPRRPSGPACGHHTDAPDGPGVDQGSRATAASGVATRKLKLSSR